MEIPNYQKFTISDIAQLKAKLASLKLNIPVSEDISILTVPLAVGYRQKLPNRLCVQPMEGCDATANGSPGPLTRRRYSRYAEGGSGLIWMEATAVVPGASTRAGQLCLHAGNIEAFADLVTSMRKAAARRWEHDVIIILQLAHGGRLCNPDPVLVHHNPVLDVESDIDASTPLATDADLERIRDEFIAAAQHAATAGFDGVDVKTCHNDLLSELLGARTRDGAYGGSFENRTRLVLDVFAGIHECKPELLLSTRMSGYDANAFPYGFGGAPTNPQEADLDEPRTFAKRLVDVGVDVLNVSSTAPRQPTSKHANEASPADAAMNEIGRKIAITQAIQEAVPDTIVVGGDISGFRQFAPQVAAGIINGGGATVMGLGRLALAYPDAMADILKAGKLVPEKTCMLCGACIELLRSGTPTGCVIRDPAVYGPEYRHQRQFSLDYLKHEAQRCHNCEAATCRAACPNGIDVPAFIKAFESDHISEAYAVLQRNNVLPEMCSHLCPAWLLCEGACIEKTLTGRPIPIRDIQYVVSWLAREETDIGIPIPSEATGKQIAVIGAGPAGLSAAAMLSGKGHHIVLFERGVRLGGTPESVIPASRYPGAQMEIEARLRPALEAGRIKINYGRELGVNLELDPLREKYDAVLLTTGLWQEHALVAERPNGVIGALTFLAETKQGLRGPVPPRVVILCGGDSAMDAAREAQRLGASEITIIFGGQRSEMHWHMDEAWTASEGVNLMTMTEPIGYSIDAKGTITGVKCHRTDITGDAGFELPVGMVIEAMGLRVADCVRESLTRIDFTEIGLVRTLDDPAFSTALDGVFAAGSIINGGASVAQCIAEGMQVAKAIEQFCQSCPDNML